MDTGRDPKGIQKSDVEMEAPALERANIHGEWNYLIKPGVL